MGATIRRIGILTGGGDCPGLNAVIRAVVKSTILQHGWEVLGIRDGFDGLARDDASLIVPMDYKSVQGLLPRGGTVLGTSNRGDPFHYQSIENGQVVYKDVSKRVMSKLRALAIDALVVVGGDGTMRIASRLMELGAKIVGVPKTIDNDLPSTDYTFGFDTALQTAMEAIDRLHTTAESHDRVMILEVMGRDAGWIALYSGIAGGTDAILIPELPYRVEAIADKLEARRARGSRVATIVISEGAYPAEGSAAVLEASTPGRLRRLGGAGDVLAEALGEQTELETRVTVLGHLQRGGSPSPFDRILGTRFGTAAVDLLAAGELGRMVCLRGRRIESVPLGEVAGQKLVVPETSQLVKCAKDIGIVFGD